MSDAPTFAEQLHAALEDTPELSVAELGRRLAALTGATAESERRWLQKVLRGQVQRPRRQTVEMLEQALGRPGYFTPPSRRPLQQERLRQLEQRLEEVQRRLDEIAGRQEEVAVMAVQNGADLDAARAEMQARLATVESALERPGP